jgi:hypothetical protein
LSLNAAGLYAFQTANFQIDPEARRKYDNDEEQLERAQVCKIKLRNMGNDMRFLPTMIHGVLDYLVGLLVIVLPFALGLQGSQKWALVILGLLVIVYSALTDYELGLARYLRIRFHLLLDTVFGLAMLLMPWLLDFPADARWPNYVLGVLALVLVAVTDVRALGTAATK